MIGNSTFELSRQTGLRRKPKGKYTEGHRQGVPLLFEHLSGSRQTGKRRKPKGNNIIERINTNYATARICDTHGIG